METLKSVLQVAGPIALILGIVGVVASFATFLLSRSLFNNREEFRKLKIAVQGNPTDQQLRKAFELCPEALQYPESQRISELIKVLNKVEGKKAQTVEVAMTATRQFLALAVICAVIYVASLLIGKQG